MNNRLLALEHVLHGPPGKPGKPRKRRGKRKPSPPRHRAQNHRPRVARRHRVRVRSQAFDWDEPIELTYNSESDSYVASDSSYADANGYDDETYDDDAYEASAFDWDDDDDEAEALGWEDDEDEDDDEAEALSWEDDEDEDDDEAEALNWEEAEDEDDDEAEALNWAETEAEAEAFGWEDNDEAEAFEVESFDEDDDWDTSGTGDRRGSQSLSAIELDEETLAKDLDFIDLDAAAEHDEPSRAMSASDFAADLQAIINGEKTYDRDRGGMISADPEARQLSTATSTASNVPDDMREAADNPHDVFSRMSQHMPHNQMGSPPVALAKSEEATPAEEQSPHDVFDRMGHNMSYANSFDLGSISLEQRFDELDELLDQNQRTQSKAKTDQDGNGAKTQGASVSLALDEAALEEDLAQMQALSEVDAEAEKSNPNELKAPLDQPPATEEEEKTESNPEEQDEQQEEGRDEEEQLSND